MIHGMIDANVIALDEKIKGPDNPTRQLL